MPKKRARAIVGGALLAVALISIPSCATGSASKRDNTEELPLRPNPQAGTTSTALELERYAKTRHPDHFTGVALEAEGEIVVFRVASADMDRTLSQRFGEAKLVFLDREYSAVELDRVVKSIAGDLKYWETRGIEIHRFGISPDFRHVQVGTPQGESVQPAFVERYGRIIVTVKSEGAIEFLGESY